jgi:hypothetical protein
MHVATSGPTPGARTGYAAPFLGRAHVTTSNGSVVVLPTDSVSLHVIDRDGGHTQHIELPFEPGPFRSNPAIAHRDSVLARMSDEARSQFPFAEDNLRETFGSDFPVPEHAPAFQRMVAVGAEQVWLQAFRHPGDDVTSWYVVDLPQERVVGRIELPHERVVLGGAGTRVFVLERDAFDVEVLRVYEVAR